MKGSFILRSCIVGSLCVGLLCFLGCDSGTGVGNPTLPKVVRLSLHPGNGVSIFRPSDGDKGTKAGEGNNEGAVIHTARLRLETLIAYDGEICASLLDKNLTPKPEGELRAILASETGREFAVDQEQDLVVGVLESEIDLPETSPCAVRLDFSLLRNESRSLDLQLYEDDKSLKATSKNNFSWIFVGDKLVGEGGISFSANGAEWRKILKQAALALNETPGSETHTHVEISGEKLARGIQTSPLDENRETNRRVANEGDATSESSSGGVTADAFFIVYLATHSFLPTVASIATIPYAGPNQLGLGAPVEAAPCSVLEEIQATNCRLLRFPTVCQASEEILDIGTATYTLGSLEFSSAFENSQTGYELLNPTVGLISPSTRVAVSTTGSSSLPPLSLLSRSPEVPNNFSYSETLRRGEEYTVTWDPPSLSRERVELIIGGGTTNGNRLGVWCSSDIGGTPNSFRIPASITSQFTVESTSIRISALTTSSTTVPYPGQGGLYRAQLSVYDTVHAGSLAVED